MNLFWKRKEISVLPQWLLFAKLDFLETEMQVWQYLLKIWSNDLFDLLLPSVSGYSKWEFLEFGLAKIYQRNVLQDNSLHDLRVIIQR